MGRPHRCATLLLCALLSACSAAPKRALDAPERVLETNNATTMLFHSVLYYPAEISLNAPGYILGVEKSPVRTITLDGDLQTSDHPAAGLSAEAARNELMDIKILYLSHIIDNRNRPFGEGNCSLHNAYVQPDDADTRQLVPPCPGISPAPVAPNRAYHASWAALNRLAISLRARIAAARRDGTPFSHILVLTMGWNTVQEEALRNFNSIIKNIRLAGGKAFNPLVIGVTWPSQWQSDWLGPLYKLVSFPVKARDADELGLSWLGVLLHDTLPRADNRLPVVVIGHSFGSRAASMATCVGPAIHPPGGEAITPKPFPHLTLINLQGAFQIERLLGSGGDRKIIFPGRCANASQGDSRIFLTASVHDQAMDTAFWGVYAGNDKSYRRFCEQTTPPFNCLRARASGELESQAVNGSPISYIDASELIYQNAYLSGGGAHSDIYRPEHGVLLWQLIAPPP
ncbi:hypothetical protein [Aestuariirhabdus litorea]|uniref:Alpha/beta hydrolase n=1 Tax=Aestuariirhabdus litorea TaxID=2528527 RepID=A0A3P3VMH4_9GAMM|nr:hypothetical protein [Aestuariirhabdus litorea]RRJ82919.1 hypothetical protein D0544_13805 [Aestuariirhabdus litorea]RWW93078.1 hypothetical protein DZC74_13780 [Endozoicomonadaceae bacterium GTF-13]